MNGFPPKLFGIEKRKFQIFKYKDHGARAPFEVATIMTSYLSRTFCSIQASNLYYSLRPIILFANIDVSRHILVVDTSVLGKSNMDEREYLKRIKVFRIPLISHSVGFFFVHPTLQSASHKKNCRKKPDAPEPDRDSPSPVYHVPILLCSLGG
jgi:hypothetical protein